MWYHISMDVYRYALIYIHTLNRGFFIFANEECQAGEIMRTIFFEHPDRGEAASHLYLNHQGCMMGIT